MRGETRSDAMDLGWIVDGVLFVTVVVLALLLRASNEAWRDAISGERKERREEDYREADLRWELHNEVSSGFEALGLVRKLREPARGPSWAKKTD
jgi:hypothetical protein